MKRSLLALLLPFLASPCFADSTSFDQFALQGGRFPLSTSSNPLLTTSSPGLGPWDALLFFTTFNFNGQVSIEYQLDIGTFHFVNIDSFQCVDCAYSQVYLLPGFAKPTQGKLTVTVNGVTEVYALRFAAVPESGSFLLLGAGLVGIGWQMRKRSIGGYSHVHHRRCAKSAEES